MWETHAYAREIKSKTAQGASDQDTARWPSILRHDQVTARWPTVAGRYHGGSLALRCVQAVNSCTHVVNVVAGALMWWPVVFVLIRCSEGGCAVEVEVCIPVMFPADMVGPNGLTEAGELLLGRLGKALDASMRRGAGRKVLQGTAVVYQSDGWRTRFPGPEGEEVPVLVDDDEEADEDDETG